MGPVSVSIESVPVSLLVLDLDNARLGEPQESQPEAYLALAKQQGRKIIELAKDIVEYGTDPTTLLAVVATEGRRRRYKVIEGNRRTLALKALETPSIILNELSPNDQKQLQALSKRYLDDPIEEVHCALFDTEDEARHWVKLRHTGANEGVGLVEWNSDEKDRWDARHGGRNVRSAAGQVVDFLAAVDGANAGHEKVPVTTLKRLLNTPAVRERLGLEKTGGRLLSHYPKNEVAKGLRRLVDDLRSRAITVPDVYTETQRLDYINNLPESDLPDPKTRLPEPLPFEELPVTKPAKASGKKTPPKPKPTPKTKTRLTVVPDTCKINPAPPRINKVYNELLTLDATTFPNAASVLLRVFLELSVDHYLEQHHVMAESIRRNTVLAKRLKAVADDLHKKNAIPDALRKAVTKVADSQHTIAASVTAFNQYVHNEYVYPKPSEIQTAWDELQPFLEKVWA